MPSPPFRAEKEGTRCLVGLQPTDGFGGGGEGVSNRSGIPHLTPASSTPKGGEGVSDGA
jgi:hypothetical protein